MGSTLQKAIALIRNGKAASARRVFIEELGGDRTDFNALLIHTLRVPRADARPLSDFIIPATEQVGQKNGSKNRQD